MDPPASISDGVAVSGLIFAGIYSATGLPSDSSATAEFWVVVSCTEVLPGAPQGPQETKHIARAFEVTNPDEDDMPATPVRTPSRKVSTPQVVQAAQLGEVAPKAAVVALPLLWNHGSQYLIGDVRKARLRFELISQDGASQPKPVGSKNFAVRKLLDNRTQTIIQMLKFRNTDVNLRVKLRLMFFGDMGPAVKSV
eukprot:gnl/TRDRNA2_/TRDRNA2_96552_c0_seq1.p1 gnl/TRDRNA2_/TRDRNA2_96552_c0~~gnl/TRDRNA2_/TRDRNA2_96552_c0_seq1.p1  ORF type:complete len:221 (+),score=17.61 gnl/TRDRNA2_/TRDRNA2_96552_c0_seq1:76-663(+)